MNEEGIVRKKFWEGIEIVRKNLIEEDNGIVVGFETEYNLLSDDLTPAPGEKVQRLIEKREGRGMELGAYQIELKTNPHNGKSIKVICDILKENEKNLMDNCKQENLHILRMGAVPNINPQNIQVGNNERYRIVPKYHDERRGSHIKTKIGGIDFDSAACVGLFSAVQINIQAKDIHDGIDKVNRALMIGPYVAAICGNSRIINGIDTGFNDIRLPAWEATHDLRRFSDMNKDNRVGLPKYYKDIDDYLTRISEQPFIFDLKNEDPLKVVGVGMGLNWKDARLKFIREKNRFYPVVELRLIPTQPSVEEDVAAMFFYIGRIAYSQRKEEEFLPIGKVRLNRDQALIYGLEGMIYSPNGDKLRTDIKKVVDEEISKAEEGLVDLGFERAEAKYFLDYLRERKQTPSYRFAEEVRQNGLEIVVRQHLLK